MKAIDLALSAGKKRKSPRTGFVHYYPKDGATDTIPLYENFCFALALFRSKTTESVLEGKALIEKLLSFQLENGNFPSYLHEFPSAWDFRLGGKVAPVLFQILESFSPYLPSAYKETLQKALRKIQLLDPPLQPTSAQDWFEWIAIDQMKKKNGSYPIPYHRELQMFLGNQVQEQFEPQPLPIEYILAEPAGFSPRLLKDHIHQLHSALLFPFTSSQEESSLPFEQSDRILWKGDKLHSLKLPPKTTEGWRLVSLPEGVEIGKDDLFEVLTFCNVSKETTLYINGKRGMVFGLNDQVSICTAHEKINLSFELVEGKGSFCGHIARSNRPGQIACKGDNLYEAYDWQIGLRTLRREGPCTIAIQCLTEKRSSSETHQSSMDALN